MNNLHRGIAAATLALGTMLGTVPASAHTSMPAASSAPMDCSKAMAMMHGAMMGHDAMGSPNPEQSDQTITVDAGYARLMIVTLQHMREMAKIEMACGKSAMMKAQAKKDMETADEHVDIFSHIPTI